MWVYFLVSYSITFVDMPVFSYQHHPVFFYTDYVANMSLGIVTVVVLSFIHDCSAYKNFQKKFSNSVKDANGILIGITLNLSI